MPGLFGVIDLGADRSPQRAQALLAVTRRMAEAMLYEPSYTVTFWCCSSIGAVVGRVGFELDASTDDRPSMHAGVLALTTGEPTRSRAARSGDVQTESHAERLARFYHQQGDHAIALTGGVRSGILCDLRRQRCLLFTDRYARERVFLHSDERTLYFASEAKSLLAVVPAARNFDADGLASVLSCGCTFSRRSLFQHVEILDGGTLLAIDSGAFARRKYASPADFERLTPSTESEFLAEFPDVLRAAVHASTDSVARFGVSLTGGLDSRMLMACLDAVPQSVPCYTFSSSFGETQDVRIAARVAAASGQSHRRIELGPDFLDSAWDLLNKAVYISDGYIGLSGAAELFVNGLARRLAPARVTGNWGGELMRGVRAFKFATPRGGFLTAEFERRMSAAAELFSQHSESPIAAALFQQIPAQGYGRYAVERSQVQMLTPFLADDVVQCLWRAPETIRASLASAVGVIGRRPELLRIPTDQGQLGEAPAALAAWRKLLRRLTTKAEYMTSHGAPDWLARVSASLPEAVLETRFLGRDKFQHFRYWMRRDLAPALEATLVHSFDHDLEAWFNRSQVAQMVTRHIAGHANFTDELDKVLTVSVAHQCLLKGAAIPADVPDTRLRIVDVSDTNFGASIRDSRADPLR